MILMIDNYDSFTYNLVQYLQCFEEEVLVYRNDAITVEEIRAHNPQMIIISPGPCTPKEAGVSRQVVKDLSGIIPILGICLGHQTIGEVFGGSVIRAKEPVHGKVHPIKHNGLGVFRNLPSPFDVTRYHSLVLDPQSLPNCFTITATTMDGQIMGIRHNTLLLEGVQFHPEAILTEYGMEVLRNFLLEAKEIKR